MTRRRRENSNPEVDARRAARRRELLDAAATVIREHGAGASMDDIAAQAGVTKPILYRHFDDRDGLARALGERFASGLLGELRGALASGTHPQELLRSTVDAYLSFVEREPEIYRFALYRSLHTQPGAGVSFTGFVRQVAGEVATVLGEALRAEGHDSGAAEPWAYGLVGMVHLAGDWWLDHRTMPRERLVAYLTSLVWDGLASFQQGAAPDDASTVRPIHAQSTGRAR